MHNCLGFLLTAKEEHHSLRTLGWCDVIGLDGRRKPGVQWERPHDSYVEDSSVVCSLTFNSFVSLLKVLQQLRKGFSFGPHLDSSRVEFSLDVSNGAVVVVCLQFSLDVSNEAVVVVCLQL